MGSIETEYFDHIPEGQQREDAAGVFYNAIRGDKLRNTTHAILGSWIVSRLYSSLFSDLSRPRLAYDPKHVNGLASEIAEAARSVIRKSQKHTTVETIIDYSISILDEIDTISALRNFFMPKNLGNISTPELKNTLVFALESMKNGVKSYVQAYDDFANLWKMCTGKSSAHQLSDLLVDQPESQRTNKELVWCLICAYRLSDGKDDPERKNNLLSIAAGISALAGAIDVGNNPMSKTLKRKRPITAEEEVEPIAKACFKDKKARRAAMKKVLSSFYFGGENAVCTSETNRRMKLQEVHPTPKASIDEWSILGSVVWAVEAMMPDLKIHSDEIEHETYKIAAFLTKHIQLAGCNSSIISTESDKRNIKNLMHAVYNKSLREVQTQGSTVNTFSGTNWVNEIKSFDIDTNLFLADSRKESYQSSHVPSIPNSSNDHERIKLTGWLNTLFMMSAHTVRPSNNLLKLLETPIKPTKGDCFQNIIIPILNECLQCYMKLANEDENKLQTSIYVGEHGVLQCHGNYLFGEQKGKLCTATLVRAFVALYYHALESILHHEHVRIPLDSGLLMNIDFHRGVACLTLMCLQNVISPRIHQRYSNWRYHFAFQISQTTYYDYLKIFESYIRSLTGVMNEHSHSLTLPTILVREIQATESIVLQTLLWQDVDGMQSKIFNTIHHIQQNGQWPPYILNGKSKEENSTNRTPSKMKKDIHFMECCMDKILVIAGQMIISLCSELEIGNRSQQIMFAFRNILKKEIDVLRNHRVDTIILCIIYFICTSTGVSPHKKFSDIMYSYEKVTRDNFRVNTLQRVFLGTGKGHIITFYNEIFLERAASVLHISNNIIESSEPHGPNMNVTIKEDCGEISNTGPRRLFTFGSPRKLSLKR